MNIAPLIDYLRRPFPKAEGFSPYRFPGMVVHLPIILWFLTLGASLTLWDPVLWALLPVYLVVGVYLGRDLAIYAHYNLLITLGVIGGSVWLLASPETLGSLLESRNIPLSVAITVTVTAGFCAWVKWFIASDEDAPAPPTGQATDASRQTRLFAASGMWLLSFIWFALVFLAAYRPEHPRSHGLSWALWLLPLVAAAVVALGFRSNADALRNRGPGPVIVLSLKLATLLLGLALPTAGFVVSHADFRLHARVAKMIDSVAPLKAQVVESSRRPQGPARSGEGIAWPADIQSDAGFIGSDGTVLIFDSSIGALAIMAPGPLPAWRCLGFPRALAPLACRDYPAPSSLEDDSTTDLTEAIAAISKLAAGLKAKPIVPSTGAAFFLPRDGDLDFGYMDTQGQIALYNDRHGILMLLRSEGAAAWRCRLLVQGKPKSECPRG